MCVREGLARLGLEMQVFEDLSLMTEARRLAPMELIWLLERSSSVRVRFSRIALQSRSISSSDIPEFEILILTLPSPQPDIVMGARSVSGHLPLLSALAVTPRATRSSVDKLCLHSQSGAESGWENANCVWIIHQPHIYAFLQRRHRLLGPQGQ